MSPFTGHTGKQIKTIFICFFFFFTLTPPVDTYVPQVWRNLPLTAVQHKSLPETGTSDGVSGLCALPAIHAWPTQSTGQPAADGTAGQRGGRGGGPRGHTDRSGVRPALPRLLCGPGQVLGAPAPASSPPCSDARDEDVCPPGLSPALNGHTAVTEQTQEVSGVGAAGGFGRDPSGGPLLPATGVFTRHAAPEPPARSLRREASRGPMTVHLLPERPSAWTVRGVRRPSEATVSSDGFA